MRDHTIVFTAGAQETWEECKVFLASQRMLAEGHGPEALLDWVGMASTLYESILQVMLTSIEYDGDVKIWADGPREGKSFYWKHEKSGYHGGLIFQPTYKDGVRQEVGRWSIHT